MNCILYEPSELQDGVLILRDGRADHVRRVLRAQVGDTLKLGEIGGSLATGTVQELTPGGVTLHVLPGRTPPRPPLDLLLALPRPKVLRRLLPQISALGVDRLYLTNAARVERPYFDTHVLEPAELRTHLLEGLSQAGDTQLPLVRVIRQLKPFVEDDLNDLAGSSVRWMLHPGAADSMVDAHLGAGDRLLLAIGPEGGWVPFELDLFRAQGFTCVTMMNRVLRSDTACVAALALASSRLHAGERA